MMCVEDSKQIPGGTVNSAATVARLGSAGSERVQTDHKS